MGALLLVLVETETLSGNDHTYHSSYCLDLHTGELVYHISNVETTSHEADYERVT